MKDILIIIGIPTEFVNAILMLYTNNLSMVRLPCGNTLIFYIAIGVPQEDKLSLFLFIICIDYILLENISG